MSGLLRTLFGYQAWANEELFDKLGELDPERHRAELGKAAKLIDHSHVVARIFMAHLTGARHGYTSDASDETPTLRELRTSVATSDRWYIDYVADVSPALLGERRAFVFTDGDKGRMSREEMLGHVILHGGYHRGEVGRILSQLAVTPPWDTLAVHLHRAEPGRRLQERNEPLPA